jgi:uncharacterized phage protein (TIGR01671 family)
MIMREVLFRGKSKHTGEWVTGAYVNKNWYPDRGIVEEANIISYEDGDECLWHLIIPETVGQYTGLTDKNGKKIFEGDIVVIDHTIKTYDWEEIPETYKPRRSHSLSYDDEKDHLTYKRNYAVEWKKKDARWILRNGSDQHNLTDVFSFFHNGIIIGNIHDNPELLKGGAE